MSNLALIDLEQHLLEQPQVECPVTHRFMPGIYVREMFAPAGTMILGHEHKTEHMCLLLKGTLEILNENGTTSELTAPMMFAAKPGRKCAIARTDVIFCNMHATEETDVIKIEDALIVKSETWLANKKKITGDT